MNYYKHMQDDFPHLVEYRKTIKDKLETVKGLVLAIQEEYSVNSLENLRKALRKIGTSAAMYGYSEAHELCQKLELDIVKKVKNFHLSKPTADWIAGLDTFTKNLNEAFSSKQQDVMKNVESKKIVVIVDDDEDIIKLLTYEFHTIGFDIKSFTTGEKALSFLMEEKNLKNVSLLVLDRVLPDMDGLDILRQFSKKYQKKVPVLILSVLATEKDIITGLESGAVDYITKPFSVFVLMQKAMNLIGR